MTPTCKHPIVKIVARQDDAEFVECQHCGDIFDAAEYEDMAVEEREGLAGGDGSTVVSSATDAAE